MTALTLNLDPVIKLTNQQFYQLCRVNPEIKFERTAQGALIVMPPTGGGTGNRNIKLSAKLEIWTEANGFGIAFDSSTMFQLPNGAHRSPDAAWISLSRWSALTPEDQEIFPPLCPDFVVELHSPSDSLRSLRQSSNDYPLSPLSSNRLKAY